ncbi:MAG: hypothetical protein L0216_19820 [Planctomycetales bacterium]|nr:hypothetical protein [Planctomycetales bacterium]
MIPPRGAHGEPTADRETFLRRADRIAGRLGEHVEELRGAFAAARTAGSASGRGEAIALEEFASRQEPLARRLLDLDRGLPVPPTECLAEESALLLALQTAANAVLQLVPDEEGGTRKPLNAASFALSLDKSLRHLETYRQLRAAAPPPPAAPR